MADVKAPITLQQGPRTSQFSRSQHIQDRPLHSWDPEEERRVRQTIAESAVQNTELLGELSTTSSAVGQFNNAEVRADHLEKQLGEQDSQVRLTTKAANVQLKQHKRYRDSVARKLVYTIANKRDNFDKTATEVEKGFHEALAERRSAEDRLNELKTDKKKLLQEQETLAALVKRHQAAHDEIDRLYSAIFDGPTAGFPDEDEQEAQYGSANTVHKETTEELKATVKGFKSIATIRLAIERATFEKSYINFESRSSFGSLTYVGGRMGRLALYVKRGLELSDAAVDGLAQPLDRDLVQAKTNVDALLQSILAMSQEQLMSRSQAVSLSERMDTALREAQEGQKIYVEEIKAVNLARRLAIRDTARNLENERQALQQIRQSLFELTVGFGAAAPPYHECCDRADGFESDSDAQCSRIVDPVVVELPDMAPPEYAQ